TSTVSRCAIRDGLSAGETRNVSAPGSSRSAGTAGPTRGLGPDPLADRPFVGVDVVAHHPLRRELLLDVAAQLIGVELVCFRQRVCHLSVVVDDDAAAPMLDHL